MKQRKSHKQGGNMQTETIERDIDNPNFSKAHAGMAGNPRTVPVEIKRSESPAMWLWTSTPPLLDDAQYWAAGMYRKHFERAGGSGVGSVDFTRDIVDGGLRKEDISDAKMQAGIELKECQVLLGWGYPLVRMVCGEGQFIHKMTTNRNVQRMNIRMLRDSLNILAKAWGRTN